MCEIIFLFPHLITGFVEYCATWINIIKQTTSSWTLFYRPQRSCGQGYVFTRVCDSVNGGVCLSACWDTTPPRSRHPPEQTPPRSRLQHSVKERPVRILLECILVMPFQRHFPPLVWNRLALQKFPGFLFAVTSSLNNIKWRLKNAFTLQKFNNYNF